MHITAVLQQAVQNAFADAELSRWIDRGDGGVSVRKELQVPVVINGQARIVVLEPGFHELDLSTLLDMEWQAKLEENDSTFFAEGVKDLPIGVDGLVHLSPAQPLRSRTSEMGEKNSAAGRSGTTPSSGAPSMGCVLLLIVVFFAGFITLAPPLLGGILRLMSGPMAAINTKVLCEGPVTQEVITVSQAQMVTSGRMTQPVVTTPDGRVYMAFGNYACVGGYDVQSQHPLGDIGKYIPGKSYLVKAREIEFGGRKIKNLEQQIREASPEEATHK